MARILGRGAPTAATFGILGQEYIDELTGIRYVCTKSTHKTGARVGEADQQCEWVPDQAGGTSSWNDLTDKPFGEIIKNDTLVVDWDTFEPKVVETTMQGFVKVSDIVPTLKDFVNGAGLDNNGYVEEIPQDEIESSYNQFGCLYRPWSMAVIPSDNFSLYDPYDNFTLTFPEKGIYFDGYGRPSSFTINGFNGFANTTDIKKVDRKYLPEPIVVFTGADEASKVFDGTYKFENTVVVYDAVYDGEAGVKILYPVRYDPNNNDAYTYASLPFLKDGKYVVQLQTYQASGSLAGNMDNQTIYLNTQEQ